MVGGKFFRLVAFISHLSWFGIANASLEVPTGATINVPSIGVSAGCGAIVISGHLSVGNGRLSSVSSFSIEAGGIVALGSGMIIVGGDWANSGDFIPGTSTIVLGDSCGSTGSTLFGETIFHNLTLTSEVGNTVVISAGSSITVNGTLTLTGIPSTPLRLISEGGENVIIRLSQGARLIRSDTQIDPSVQILGDSSIPVAIPVIMPAGIFFLIFGLVAIAFRYHRYTV